MWTWRRAFIVTSVGTHSCKSTCLSWCAKAGVGLDVRKMLGYHSGGSDTTALCYSRDAMAGPLATLQQVVDDIASGTLMPDHTRSGNRPPVHDGERLEESSAAGGSEQDPGGEQLVLVSGDDSTGAAGILLSEKPDAEELEGDSEDSGDEEDQDLDRDLDREAESAVVPPWRQFDREVFRAAMSQGLFRHRYSSMFHLVMDEGGTHLKCGKPIPGNYDRVEDEPKFVYPMCSVCFR